MRPALAVVIASLVTLTGCASSTLAPLYRAAESGDIAGAEALIGKGADLDEVIPNTPRFVAYDAGFAPLHIAAKNGHVEMVRLLLSAGADIEVQEQLLVGQGSLRTPLHIAAMAGEAEVVRVLLDAGADPGRKDHYGDTPRALAEKEGRTIVSYMLEEAENALYARYHRNDGVRTGDSPADTTAADTAAQSPPVDSKAAPIAPGGTDFGNYHALVIGIDAYRDLPHLTTARSDASAVTELLRRDYGFEVELLVDATRADVLRALNRYRQTLGDRDNLLIYYAGHGWLDEAADQGYWLPVDAMAQDPTNWISNGSITDTLKAMQARHVLVIADSCYSGKMVRGVNIRLETPNYFERIAGKRSRTVMASGGLEPILDEGARGGHSAFASALLDALKENRGTIDATSLFTRVRRPVMLSADQTPEYSDIRKAGHDGGDFIFVRRTAESNSAPD